MLSFKAFFAEDAQQQGQGFVQAFRAVYPDATVEPEGSGYKATAMNVQGRNIVASWSPGLPRMGPEYQKDQSYAKIDFFHTQPDEQGDYVGAIKKTGLTPNTMSFTGELMKLVKALKNLNIHIWFDAVGMKRADSYSRILQGVGYTLGHKSGVRQLWLASPVEGLQPQTTPSGAVQPQNSGIALTF